MWQHLLYFEFKAIFFFFFFFLGGGVRLNILVTLSSYISYLHIFFRFFFMCVCVRVRVEGF